MAKSGNLNCLLVTYVHLENGHVRSSVSGCVQTKSVVEQQWPSVDDDFKVPMLVKVSCHYVVCKTFLL